MNSDVRTEVEVVAELRNYDPGPAEAGTRYVDLVDLAWSVLAALLAEAKFLLRFCFAGALLTTAVVLLIPSWYRASTRVMMSDAQSSSVSMLAAGMAGGGQMGSAAASLLGLRSPGSQMTAVLKSRSVADAMIDRFHLDQVYRKRLRVSVREELSGNSTFIEDRQANMMTITVTDRRPDRAAAMANAYVDELNRMLVQINTSGAHRQRMFLEERLGSVTADLQNAEKELGEFSSKNTTIDPAIQGKSMIDAAAKMEGELAAERAQLQGLLQIYGNDSARIRSSRAKIAELERERARMTGSQDGSAADASPDGGGSPYPPIRRLPLLGSRYADLYRRARVQQAVFETLTKQYEFAKLEEAQDTPTVSVLDVAEPPVLKAGPPRGLWVISGTILCFVLAGAILWFEKYWMELDGSHPAKLFWARVQRLPGSGILRSPVLTPVTNSGRYLWILLRFGRSYPSLQRAS